MTLRAYRLIHRLGIGGDGEVWLARTPAAEEVALKARLRHSGADEQRLMREFQQLRALRLPSVIRVLDVGADQGYVYFTMDVARGRTLDLWVAEAADLADRVRRTVRAGEGVARALAGIHRLGLAHQDVKPANIVVDPEGKAVLLDFGTARFAAAEAGAIPMGTLGWLAPEQRAGQLFDHRADIYAFGLCLYQSISGNRGSPGGERPSLSLLGAEVPLALGDLVDRMIELDPADRPPAEECEQILGLLARGHRPWARRWPRPPIAVPAPPALMEGSGLLIGPTGSGRASRLRAARLRWSQMGYRSVAGSCQPERPFGAIRAVFGELLPRSGAGVSAALAEADARWLPAIWPDLPIAVAQPEPWPPDALEVARVLGKLLAAAAPIALVLTDIDEADAGTASVIAGLLMRAPEGLRIWGTARRGAFGLPEILPLPWTQAEDQALISALVHPDSTRIGPAGARPLLSCARGWAALARARGEPPPPTTVPEVLAPLSVLREPFPVRVAEALIGPVIPHIRAGFLLPCGAGGPEEATGEDRSPEEEATQPIVPDHLVFSEPLIRRLASAALPSQPLAHAAAVTAWTRFLPDPAASLAIAAHALAAGRPTVEVLDQAIEVGLDRGDPAEVERWIQLRDLHCGTEGGFLIEYARLFAALELRPTSVDPRAITELGTRARSTEERGLVAYLHLLHAVRAGADGLRTHAYGQRWADQLAAAHPAIASTMLREAALAALSAGEPPAAIGDCERAIFLARRAAGEGSLSPAEVGATTTLSAALLYAGRTEEAALRCASVAEGCRRAGFARGEGALMANLAIARLHQGRRAQAADAIARCRAVQPAHRDPLVLGHVAMLQARLSVERGDLQAGRPLLDEAINAAQASGSRRLLAEAWAVGLDAALHSFDLGEAQRALATYGEDGVTDPRDHWPAALGRWRWMTGDLDGALAAVEAPRSSHGGLCVAAERARLLLVSGRYVEARAAALEAANQASRRDYAELSWFSLLVMGAASGATDEEFLPLLEQGPGSRWVHGYLGSIHLDAIRRQLRGENVSPILRRLRARAADLGHRLYLALARPEAW